MAALTDNRDTRELANGRGQVAKFDIVNAEIVYAGGMLAVDSAGEVHAASDTLGLRVLGRVPAKVDNTADGEKSEPQRGIFRYANHTSNALSRNNIGQPCYVVDDQTVAASSTNLVPAGLVFDVDSEGVWVDQSLAACQAAIRMARQMLVAVTATTATLSAAQVFQGNVVVTAVNASGTVLTLPTAAAGYRIGVQRIDATAGRDVTITAPTGDKVRGSAAAGSAVNDTDAVSDILYLETVDATDWVDAFPLAKDRAEWAPST